MSSVDSDFPGVKAIFQEALRCHYSRCELFHLWERQFATAVETGSSSASSLEAEGFTAQLQEVVFQPLQQVNVQLRSLQSTVKAQLEKEEESGFFAGSETASRKEKGNYRIRRLHRFFVRWVDKLQQAERTHFEQMVNLGREVSSHISSSFLRGHQCEACLIRAEAEWSRYAKAAAAKEERAQRKKFTEEMQRLAQRHREGAGGCGCGGGSAGSTGAESPATEHHSEEEEEKGKTEEEAEEDLGPEPIPPCERHCPHLSVHDLQTCLGYRLLVLRWGRLLHHNGRSSSASPLQRMAEAREAHRLRLEAEEENPWLARLRHVHCPERRPLVDADFSSSVSAVEEEEEEEESTHPLRDTVDATHSAQWLEGKRVEAVSSFTVPKKPPFSVRLPVDESPIYALGDEQEAEAAEEERAQEMTLRERHHKPREKGSQRDRLHQLRAKGKLGGEGRGAEEAEEDLEYSRHQRAMATYRPEEVRHRCLTSASALQRIIASRTELEKEISELAEELQAELYDMMEEEEEITRAT